MTLSKSERERIESTQDYKMVLDEINGIAERRNAFKLKHKGDKEEVNALSKRPTHGPVYSALQRIKDMGLGSIWATDKSVKFETTLERPLNYHTMTDDNPWIKDIPYEVQIPKKVINDYRELELMALQKRMEDPYYELTERDVQIRDFDMSKYEGEGHYTIKIVSADSSDNQEIGYWDEVLRYSLMPEDVRAKKDEAKRQYFEIIRPYQ